MAKRDRAEATEVKEAKKPATKEEMLVRIFGRQPIDTSRARLYCYESNGECFVRCKATPATGSFRVCEANADLMTFVKAEHANTMELVKAEKDKP